MSSEIERLKAQAQYYYKAHKEALVRLKQLQAWTNDFRCALGHVLNWMGSCQEMAEGETVWSEIPPERMCELKSLLEAAGFRNYEGGHSIPMPEMVWHTEDSEDLRAYIYQLTDILSKDERREVLNELLSAEAAERVEIGQKGVSTETLSIGFNASVVNVFGEKLNYKEARDLMLCLAIVDRRRLEDVNHER